MRSHRGNYSFSKENDEYLSRAKKLTPKSLPKTIVRKNRFSRGKYYGWLIGKVKEKDPDYYNWALKKGLLGDY
jgi:hypothetical protein